MGFEVAVRLLLTPERGWSERELSEELGRSNYAVHRALERLHRLGYVRRDRGDTRLRDLEGLRDQLTSSWARRLKKAGARAREAKMYASPDPRRVREDALEAARAGKARIALAGPWATSGPGGLVGDGPLTVYVDDEGTALESFGFEPIERHGDLIAWFPAEPGAVFLAPRELEGGPTTNHVITYLDLMATGIDRYRDAAEALWRERGPWT